MIYRVTRLFLPVVLLVSWLWIGSAWASVPLARHLPAAPATVSLNIDGTSIAGLFTVAQALAHAHPYLTFVPHLPRHLPAGGALRALILSTFSGYKRYALVTLDYSGSGSQQAFSLTEGMMLRSTNSLGHARHVKIGNVMGLLAEQRLAGQHTLEVFWIVKNLGFDLRTLQANTTLTSALVVAMARSIPSL